MIEVQALPPEPAESGYRRHRAEFRARDGTRILRVLAPDHAAPLSDDWLLPPALLFGMRRAEPVRIQGTVSPMLLHSLERIQLMLQAHAEARHPLHRIDLTPTGVAARAPRAEAGTVSTFSAGLDSFHTALTLDSELDGLLYVHGYEATPDDEAQLFLLLPQIKAAARDLGKPLLLVDSDHWELVWRNGGRSEVSTHAMLIMIGLLMGSHVRRLVLPASYTQAHEDANWDSLTKFVALWRTEHFTAEPHGTISRTEKLRHIAPSDVAMRRLRVCWKRRGKAYNCGRCLKCVRTLVNLELAGLTGRCRTLPSTLRLEQVETMPSDALGRAALLPDYLAEAEAQGREDLAAALRVRLAAGPPAPPRPWMRPLRRLGKVLRDAPVRRESRRTRRALRSHRREHGDAHLFATIEPAD